MTAQREQEVISQVLGGDANAFEELVIEYQKTVYNIALKITKNETDAMDVSQEAFLRAYTRLSQFTREGRFSMWICKLTSNLAIDFIRKKSRERDRIVPILSRNGEDEDREIQVVDPAALPEERAITKELADEIVECIDILPYESRMLLIMRNISGMTYSEIAETLGISEGTVKSRISRCRKKLLKILQKRGTISVSNRLIKGN